MRTTTAAVYTALAAAAIAVMCWTASATGHLVERQPMTLDDWEAVLGDPGDHPARTVGDDSVSGSLR